MVACCYQTPARCCPDHTSRARWQPRFQVEKLSCGWLASEPLTRPQWQQPSDESLADADDAYQTRCNQSAPVSNMSYLKLCSRDPDIFRRGYALYRVVNLRRGARHVKDTVVNSSRGLQYFPVLASKDQPFSMCVGKGITGGVSCSCSCYCCCSCLDAVQQSVACELDKKQQLHGRPPTPASHAIHGTFSPLDYMSLHVAAVAAETEAMRSHVGVWSRSQMAPDGFNRSNLLMAPATGSQR